MYLYIVTVMSHALESKVMIEYHPGRYTESSKCHHGGTELHVKSSRHIMMSVHHTFTVVRC